MLAWQALCTLRAIWFIVCAGGASTGCAATVPVLLHRRDYACHGCGSRLWTSCTHPNAFGTLHRLCTRLGCLGCVVPHVPISPPCSFTSASRGMPGRLIQRSRPSPSELTHPGPGRVSGRSLITHSRYHAMSVRIQGGVRAGNWAGGAVRSCLNSCLVFR